MLDPGDNASVYINCKKAIKIGMLKFSYKELAGMFSKEDIEKANEHEKNPI